MNYLKIFLGIFLVLAASRFIPHPPNFTSLIALSFYVPALLGKRYISAVVLSFAITDFFIGFHSLMLITWGSILVIGYFSRLFYANLKMRCIGIFGSALLFFILSNLGVWLTGTYGYTLNGLVSCYILAIPFFYNTLLSTILFSILIETIYFLFKKKLDIRVN